MEGLLLFGAVVSALASLGALALRFGVDSRDDSTDPRSPERVLTA